MMARPSGAGGGGRPAKPCVVCSKVTKRRCSQCLESHYCCREHQLADWRNGHKLACKGKGKKKGKQKEDADEAATAELHRIFDGSLDLVATVRSFLSCTRCQGPCEAGAEACRIPHPSHLLQDQGGCFSAEGMQSHFGCMACGRSFTVCRPSSSQSDGALSDVKTVTGAEFCFKGPHSLAAVPDADTRRVDKAVVALEHGASLQQEIDELAPEVKTVTIRSGGCFDSSAGYGIPLQTLANLVELRLVDINFNRITLDDETTPRLRILQMQNVPNECDLTIAVSTLEDIDWCYWQGDEKDVQVMLDCATNLKRFSSYKLWVYNLSMASPVLSYVRLHRSDALGMLRLWAPRLEELDLQACFGPLHHLEFIPTHPHPLAAHLPENFTFRKPLKVNLVNASLGQQAMRALEEHPRVDNATLDTGDY